MADQVRKRLGLTSATKTDKTNLQSIMTKRRQTMPQEIRDVEKFIQMSDHAHYCDIKRVSRVVKLKLRTPGGLYTLKADPGKAEEIIKKLRCEIREV